MTRLAHGSPCVGLGEHAWTQIVTIWKGRSGIKSNIRADYGGLLGQYLCR